MCCNWLASKLIQVLYKTHTHSLSLSYGLWAYRQSLCCIWLEVEAVVGAGEGPTYSQPSSPDLLRALEQLVGLARLCHHQLACQGEREGEEKLLATMAAHLVASCQSWQPFR